jgi:hypothetical protein
MIGSVPAAGLPYEKAQRKHKAGIELLFAEAGRGTV